MVLPYINMNPPWCTRVPHPEPPSHIPPHTIPLGHPSAPAPSILYQASNLDWWFVFTYDIIHVLMPFSQIISPSPSPTEFKRLFYTSVSLLLPLIQGNLQSRFDAWYRMLRAGALGWPRGMVWTGRWEGRSGWGTRVHPWRIHFDVWQNQYNIVKLKKKKNTQNCTKKSFMTQIITMVWLLT